MKWISVKDQLPPPYSEVFIYPRPDFGLDVWTGEHGKQKGDIDYKWYVAIYEHHFGVAWYKVHVTHWMPLMEDPC